MAGFATFAYNGGISIAPDRPVSSSLPGSGLQLELACLPTYRMASLGLASLLARQQFGKAVLDELHKRFGWIPLYDHMNHSVENQKGIFAFGYVRR